MKKSRLKVFLLIMALSLLLTACLPREPITPDVFKETIEKLGYTAIDITDQYAAYPHIVRVFGCEDNGVHVEFLEIDNPNNAAAVFAGNKAQVESFKGIVSSSSYRRIGNYEKYTLHTGGTYYHVKRVENTVVYAYSDESESRALDDIIKEMGY